MLVGCLAFEAQRSVAANIAVNTAVTAGALVLLGCAFHLGHALLDLAESLGFGFHVFREIAVRILETLLLRHKLGQCLACLVRGCQIEFFGHCGLRWGGGFIV